MPRRRDDHADQRARLGRADRLGADRALPADGYTLGLFLLPNLSTAVIINEDLPYTLDDFQFLSNYYGNSPTIAVPSDSSIMSIDEVLERARREVVNIGIASIGNEDTFLLSGLMRADPSLQFQVIPLGSGPQVLSALLGGHVDVGVYSLSNLRQADGQLKALAVATSERVEDMADVPTFVEKGFDVVETTAHLVGAPAGLPDEVADKLTACFDQVAQDPEFLEAARAAGMRMNIMNAEQVNEHLRTKTEQLRKLWEEDPWIQ